jgi:predicted AAA+ superfamily ATPase
VIDEAQNIPNIGMGLKILVDQIPTIRIIATGSSSFELAGQIGEPLTGRKTTLTLYPIAQLELRTDVFNAIELKEKLPEYLIYGSYPEVISESTQKGKIHIIEELVNSYLLKDVLALADVKGSKVLTSMLKLLAFQIGCQVSLNEIANSVNIDVKTVGRYLDLLEKAFVIARLGGFSRNLRSEITSKSKYYFLDTGIRNGIIQQFNRIDLRDDIGKLWENFLFIERLKYRTYKNIYANSYFWRTYSQQEIDLIEDREGKIHSYEYKWSEKRRTHAPVVWKTAYPDASFTVINANNYLEFIS